jgi:hypothetical protein
MQTHSRPESPEQHLHTTLHNLMGSLTSTLVHPHGQRHIIFPATPCTLDYQNGHDPRRVRSITVNYPVSDRDPCLGGIALRSKHVDLHNAFSLLPSLQQLMLDPANDAAGGSASPLSREYKSTSNLRHRSERSNHPVVHG